MLLKSFLFEVYFFQEGEGGVDKTTEPPTSDEPPTLTSGGSDNSCTENNPQPVQEEDETGTNVLFFASNVFPSCLNLSTPTMSRTTKLTCEKFSLFLPIPLFMVWEESCLTFRKYTLS